VISSNQVQLSLIVATEKLPATPAVALHSSSNKSSPPPVAVPAAVLLMKVNLTTPLVTPLKMKTTTDLPDLVPTAAPLAELHLVLSQQLPLLPCLVAVLLLEVEVGSVVLSTALALTLIANTLMTHLSGVKALLLILFFAMLVVLAGFEMAP
jgi:hypothetical protein